MSDITVTALGIAAVKIESEHTVIYADAFINTSQHPIPRFDYSDADTILVTHDHADHFDAKAVAAAAKETGATVVGPPSIAYPLLAAHALCPTQLKVLYSENPGTAAEAHFGNTAISSFASPHFNNSDNITIHNSYLIDIGGCKIYITGDSYAITRKDRRLYDLDALICNIVFFDQDAQHLRILCDYHTEYHPKLIIPVHMMNFEWTVPIDAAKEKIRELHLDNAHVPDKDNPSVGVTLL